MALIIWKDEYSVGVASFDGDHRQLVRLVNHLHDRLQAGAASEALARLGDELIEHTLAHFGREQSYFEKTHYPRAAAHRLTYEQLKQRILQFRKDLNRRPPPLGKFVFFTDWLTHHIAGEDKDLGVHLNAQGIH